MIIYSWNVNGLRAAINKNYRQWFAQTRADVVCLQEIKARPDQLEEQDRDPEGYQAIWNHSKLRQGYSGVAAFCKIPPLSHSLGLGVEELKNEGRLILMEYEKFYLFNVYFPNGQKDEERLKFKLDYYDAFLSYSEELRKKKPIVVCGDFNTAHKEIDLARPKQNEKTSGFLPIERAWLDKFVDQGYVDVFRMFDPSEGRYTWWSWRAKARERNVGWRIDYFFVSYELKGKVKRAWIEPEVTGSDHCPIGLELSLP